MLGAACQNVANVTFPTADSPVAKATLAYCISSCLTDYFDKRTQKDELELRKASVEAGSASGRCSSGHYEDLLILAALCRYAKRRASSGGGMVADSVGCSRICSGARQKPVEMSRVVAIRAVDAG